MNKNSFNRVILVGTVKNNPQQSFNPNGDEISNLEIDTEESWRDRNGSIKNNIQKHDCIAYGGIAESINKYVKVGNFIYLEGRLRSRSNEEYGKITEVLIEKFTFLRKGDNTPKGYLLEGSWSQGWAVDLHTISSTHNPDGTFDTTYTEIGNRLHDLKYGRDGSAPDESEVFPIADILTDFIKSKIDAEKVDIIIPTPPSNMRRQFQPVFLLAEALGERLSIPVDFNYINKIKDIDQLKEIDDPEQRKEILSDAFDIASDKYINKSILLLDDLFRSGSTLNEITNILFNKGKVDNVIVFTVTKTRVKD